MPLASPSEANYPNYEECIVASINRYFAKRDFQSGIQIQPVTEYFLHHVLRRDYAFPFTNQRDDLSKMIEMALPHLNKTTLFHEAGCGSGEGLIETLFRGYGLDHMPGAIVGSDVNPYSLESIKILNVTDAKGLTHVFQLAE